MLKHTLQRGLPVCGRVMAAERTTRMLISSCGLQNFMNCQFLTLNLLLASCAAPCVLYPCQCNGNRVQICLLRIPGGVLFASVLVGMKLQNMCACC